MKGEGEKLKKVDFPYYFKTLPDGAEMLFDYNQNELVFFLLGIVSFPVKQDE